MKATIQTTPEIASPVQSNPTAAVKDGLHLKSLLVPRDFSETANRALDYAVAMAAQFGARVNLLHVVESRRNFIASTEPGSIHSQWDRQIVQESKDHLNQLAQDKIDELIPVNVEVQAGRAYRKICEAAQRLDSDLVVISTHGFTGLKHLFLGSTAERVVRHAPCSVLVVREHTTNPTKLELKPNRILVPTDFSKPASKALHYALDLAREFQAEIQLLYVVPMYYPASDEMLRDIAILEADLQKAGEKDLAKLVKSIRAKGTKLQTLTRRGRPATEITEAAKELNCDLIVISTHGLTGWDRVFLGSTTEEVVRHAGCPVLVVRDK